MEGETVEIIKSPMSSKLVIPFSRKDDELAQGMRLEETTLPIMVGAPVNLPRVSSRSRALELLNNACCGD